MTRDSIWWWISLIGATCASLSTSFNLFPWIPDTWQHGIALVAFIWGSLSTKMMASPLLSKKEKDDEWHT